MHPYLLQEMVKVRMAQLQREAALHRLAKQSGPDRADIDCGGPDMRVAAL